MTKYQCIECGSKIQKLYREYKAGVIKIARCESCQKVADMYIEYDPVIIFLDALLLRRQAYRHLLINTEFNSQWRVALLLWVCDAFTKLVIERAELSITHSNQEPFNYTYIGLELYVNFIIAAVELVVLLASVLTMYSIRSLWHHKSVRVMSTDMITKAVIIASVWRTLAVPALLWGQVYSRFYLWLSWGFVSVSTFQALRAVSQEGSQSVWTALVVCVSSAAQMLVSTLINARFGLGLS